MRLKLDISSVDQRQILKFDLPKFRKEAPWATTEWLEKFKDSLQTRGAKALKLKSSVEIRYWQNFFWWRKNYFATGWAKMDV